LPRPSCSSSVPSDLLIGFRLLRASFAFLQEPLSLPTECTTLKNYPVFLLSGVPDIPRSPGKLFNHLLHFLLGPTSRWTHPPALSPLTSCPKPLWSFRSFIFNNGVFTALLLKPDGFWLSGSRPHPPPPPSPRLVLLPLHLFPLY